MASPLKLPIADGIAWMYFVTLTIQMPLDRRYDIQAQIFPLTIDG